MEKENKRMKKELHKKERIRLNRLVNLSQQFDPRLIKERKQEEEEKNRRKEEIRKRKEEKKRLEEEKKQQIIDQKLKEEQLKKEKEEKDKKDKLEKEKTINEQIENFKSVFFEKINENKMDKYFLAEVLRKLRHDEILILTEKLSSNEIDTGDKFKETMKNIVLDRKKKYEQVKKEKEEKVSKSLNIKEWTDEDVKLLQKGVMKFPSGTHMRWNRITQYIGGKFTEAEVIDYAKQLKNVLTKKKNSAKFQLFKINEKKAASKEVKIDGGVEDWTQSQQNQLQKAIKKYPKSLKPQERWDKISSEVEGKDMKQCVERFKHIKKMIAEKKAKLNK